MPETWTEQQIEEKVRNVVCDQLGVKPSDVGLNSSFVDDLGADSLDFTELVVAFEDEFELEIPDAAFDQLGTVATVVHYIATHKLERRV
jgi:acyl carrier protein